MRPDLSLIIPAYNEAERIEPTVREAVTYFRTRGLAVELLVVDDGSRDDTSGLVYRLSRQFPEVALIRLAENRGKGCAVRTGVLNSRGRLVLFADADGSTPIAEVERLEAAITEGAAIAIGSRALRGGDVRITARFHRRLIGRAFHLLITALTIRGIHDTQCGFKLLRASVAQELFSRMRMNGFSFDVELLVLARRRNHRIAEVPVNWTHRPGSRIDLFRDSLRMAADLFIIRRRIASGQFENPRVALFDVGNDEVTDIVPGDVAIGVDMRVAPLSLSHSSRGLDAPAPV